MLTPKVALSVSTRPAGAIDRQVDRLVARTLGNAQLLAKHLCSPTERGEVRNIDFQPEEGDDRAQSCPGPTGSPADRSCGRRGPFRWPHRSTSVARLACRSAPPPTRQWRLRQTTPSNLPDDEAIRPIPTRCGRGISASLRTCTGCAWGIASLTAPRQPRRANFAFRQGPCNNAAPRKREGLTDLAIQRLQLRRNARRKVSCCRGKPRSFVWV
jgi:hypothetical protein